MNAKISLVQHLKTWPASNRATLGLNKKYLSFRSLKTKNYNILVVKQITATRNK